MTDFQAASPIRTSLIERMRAAISPSASLVLLPGTLCDARVFAPTMALLPRIDALILPLPEGVATTEVARRVLDLAPPRFALAGFSLGGVVALEVAALAPERLVGLALMNTNPLAVPLDTHEARREAVREAARIGLADYVRRVLWPAYVAPQTREDDKLCELIVDMAQAQGANAFAAQTEVALSRRDRRDTVRQLRCPIALLTGEHDALAPPGLQRELAAIRPSARLAIVPGAGHFAPLEAPAAVALHLAGWLEDIQADAIPAGISPERDHRRRQ